MYVRDGYIWNVIKGTHYIHYIHYTITNRKTLVVIDHMFIFQTLGVGLELYTLRPFLAVAVSQRVYIVYSCFCAAGVIQT